MTLYKCDRCGREYNTTAMGCVYAGKATNFTECRVFYEIVCKSMYHPERSIDLCGDCTNELTLWIDCNPSGADGGADDITPLVKMRINSGGFYGKRMRDLRGRNEEDN